MGTEIKTWQILDGKLTSIQSALKTEGRTEPYDLEPWLASNPDILGSDILIIGRQVTTHSGPIDLLGIDRSGNTVVVEMKRDQLARECLVQAIDYASDIADWTGERLSEVCSGDTHKTLEDAFNEAFPDVDLENLNLNSSQRIVLVGFSIEGALERMIEWLSDTYGVNINAIVLGYVKTTRGDELLVRTSIISEEMEQERRRKQKKFEIEMDDKPGTYDDTRLKELLRDYLMRDKVTNKRIRDVLLPACLRTEVLTRDELEKAFKNSSTNDEESKAGYFISLISSQLGIKRNDFLRQVIHYAYPRRPYEKDNFSIPTRYRELVKEVLERLKSSGTVK